MFHEHHEWLVKTDHFLQQMGASSGSLETIFSSLAQYRDRSNAPAYDSIVFKGSYHDFTKYPGAGCTDPKPLELGAITCLTDAQLREQLSSFIASHGLPKGMNAIYYLITPPGVTVCLDAAGAHCSDFAVSEAEAEENERKSDKLGRKLLQLPRRDQPEQSRAGRRQHRPLRRDPVDSRVPRARSASLRAALLRRRVRLPGRRVDVRRRRTRARGHEACLERRTGNPEQAKKARPKKNPNSNGRAASKNRTSRSPTRKAKANSVTTAPVSPT